MDKQLNKLTTISKNKAFLFFMIVTTILAWTNFLDEMAYEFNTITLANSSIMFGSIKGIDIISSTFENFPIVGGMAEPLENFISKVSLVMFLSLMSLSIQKIMIVIAKSYLISGAMSILSCIFLVDLKKKILKDKWHSTLMKIFLILFSFRFLIIIMTLTLQTIEGETLKLSEKTMLSNMNELEKEFLNLSIFIAGENHFKEEKDKEIKKLEIIIDELEDKIDLKKNEVSELKGSRISRLLEKNQNNNNLLIEEKEKEITKLEQEINENKKKIDSFEVGLLDKFNPINNISYKVKTALNSIKVLFQSLLDKTFNFISLILFKNIIFPLFFLWGIFKIVDGYFKTRYIIVTREQLLKGDKENNNFNYNDGKVNEK